MKICFTKSQLTDFYAQATKGIKEVKPAIKEATKPQQAVEKLTAILKAAKPIRQDIEKLVSQQRKIQTARVAAIGAKVKGEKGLFAQLGQLKGEMPKVQFEPLRGKFQQKEIDDLMDFVEQSNVLLPLEKVSAKISLGNLLQGKIPTRSELALFSEVFPNELVQEILSKRPLTQKLLEGIGAVLNVPRSVMASIDLSAPLRQGIFLVGRPGQFIPAFGNMLKYAFSEKAYQGLQQSIRSKSTYKQMRQARLALTDLGGSLASREEAIMSSLPEKIPGLGKLFRGSNRAYTGFLNKLRADTFHDIVTKSEGLGKELTGKELDDIARFVNAATGRGGLWKLDKAAVALNSIFFSPRLMASRLNLLNPYFYATLSPIARKEALRSLFSFTAIAGTTLGLAKLGGADIGVDPRSADFGKIKIGNTRYDILGGFQQYIRMASQFTTGEIVSSTTGRTITLGEGYKPLTRKDIAFRFFESKESPIASFITSLTQGSTFTGEEFDVPTEVINRFIPMVVQDLYDLSQEKGAESLLMGLPAIFGVGMQTYGKQELALGESKIGEPTSQIRPVQEMAERIREIVLGQLPLGSSITSSVDAYLDQLNNLPREEAADIYDKIAETNPDLANKIRDIVKDREKGITVKDKDLKMKGVASGDRALAIKKQLDKLKTKEEKAALWEEYAQKGIITKEVGRQIRILLDQD